MEQYKFRRNFMLWTAVAVAVGMLICGLLFGKAVEETLFLEIAKWVFMYFPICAIFEVFAYIWSGVLYHGSKYDPTSTKYKELHKNDKK